MGKARRAAQTHAKGIQDALSKVGTTFNNTMKSVFGFRGAMVALTAAGGFGLFMKNTIDAADQLSKMAQKVGVSTESLSTLKYAASISGVELEKLQTGLVRLSRNAMDVQLGLKTASEGFDALGISVKNAAGDFKTTEELLKEIATKFAQMPDGITKTALATKLFGRAGAELIPMLNLGSAGIEQLEQKARDLGIELSTETGRAAEQFNDDLQELSTHAKGLGVSLATYMLPKLTEITKAMKEAADESGLLKAAWVGLGGLGAWAFTDELDSLPEKIENTRKKLDALKKKQENLTPSWVQGAQKKLGVLGKVFGEAESYKRLSIAIQETESKLNSLEAQQAKEDEARKKRAEQLKEETQQREEATVKAEQSALRIAEAEKRRVALQSEIKTLYDSTRTPLEKYNAQLERLNDLLKIGAIDHDLYNRAVNQAQIEFDKSTEKINEHIEELEAVEDKYAELKQAIEGWGKESANAIVDFCLTGKASFSDMIQSMISDMMKMILYQQIFEPLSKGISGWIGGLFAGGGGGGSMIIGGMARGGVFHKGNLVPFERGGVVTKPTIFPMAHGAGLMGEAGHEAILPLARVRGDLGVRASVGAPVINIINNNNSEITTSTKETSQGMEIDVMLDKAIAQKMGQRNSNTNQMLRTNFSAKERLVAR
ncbi:MAG TPA: phage tail tape measure C-terminal domain-containing protein [Smithellaceae bacterium]|nr:phage tail tape measure C-terminal domain-containing protein [Smithellaceae bacterium]